MKDRQLVDEEESEFTVGDLLLQKIDEYIINYGRDPKAIVITRTGHDMLMKEVDLTIAERIESFKGIRVFISDEDVINI